MKKNKIMYVSGPGGHFTEIQKLFPLFDNIPKCVITCRRKDTEAFVTKWPVYFVTAPYRNLFRLTMNFLASVVIVIKERPSVVITTGAGVALSSCYIAWLLRAKIIHIECSAQVDSPSLFGKLVGPIVSKRFVQWESMKRFYSEAKILRLLFSTEDDVDLARVCVASQPKKKTKIFVTVGTTKESFDRLVSAIESVAKNNLNCEFFVQYGNSRCPNVEQKIAFLSIKEFEQKIKSANVVITHGGVGCIASSLQKGKRVIVVPRLSKYAEHENDHQLQITNKIGELTSCAAYSEGQYNQSLAEWISDRLDNLGDPLEGYIWMPKISEELLLFSQEIEEYLN